MKNLNVIHIRDLKQALNHRLVLNVNPREVLKNKIDFKSDLGKIQKGNLNQNQKIK